MRHLTFPLATAVLAVAATAGAQLSQEYKDWPESPAGYLLTKAERKAFAEIKNDAEAKAFIELFWAKRDPDLETVVNEFKSDFDARVEAADKGFSYGQTKGSKTDRGKVLILLGKYTQRRTYGPGDVGVQTVDRGTLDEQSGGGEVWKYAKSELAKELKADELMFVFAETRPGAGDFILDRTDRRITLGLKALAVAPEALLLHPKLTEVPRLGLLPGSKAAGAQQLAVLATEPRPWPEGGVVRAVAGVLNESIHPLWLYVQLPTATPVATQAVGRVVDAGTGAEAGSFVVAIKPVSVETGNAYEFAFPIGAGKWKVELALLGDAGPVAVTTYEGEKPDVPKEGTFFSPFYWGVDVRQEAQAHLGDPFNIGGWHVMPRLSDVYTPSEQLSYFCFVVRPGIPETPPAADSAAAQPPASPKLEISMALFSGDRKLTDVPPTPVNVSRVAGNLWMFGNGLPLEGFKKPGDYRLEMTLRDTITNASGKAAIPVKILAPPAAAPAAAPTGS